MTNPIISESRQVVYQNQFEYKDFHYKCAIKSVHCKDLSGYYILNFPNKTSIFKKLLQFSAKT